MIFCKEPSVISKRTFYKGRISMALKLPFLSVNQWQKVYGGRFEIRYMLSCVKIIKVKKC